MTRQGLVVALVALMVCPAVAAARQGGDPPTERKRTTARRVDAGQIRVDGHLDESVWQDIDPITDFVQKEPTQGVPPTDAMEVRFAYDSGAFYVGARMHTRMSTKLQAPLGRRDTPDQAEHILVSFDTFLDRRTSVVYGLTAAGVRLDRYHGTDNEDSFDSGFDPVWRGRASIDAGGWSAEFWIPFSQLRFNPESDLIWGLNVQRFRPTLNEEDTWVLIPRTVRAWSSRFGELQGITDVAARRRIEFLPYVAGASTLDGDAGVGNPFREGANLSPRVGADLKVGLGPNLTLETTINPDFGQVEADPAEVNLTAFETRFGERRAFFLEGSPLFNIGHPNFYYSRRVGARPIGPAVADFVDYPSATTILGAAKLTGRLPSKTSVGYLSAVTAEESADLASLTLPGTSSVRVAPRAFYNVGRVLQEFGRNASTAGLLASWVHRDFQQQDALADLLPKDAAAVAGNTLLRFKGGQYEFRAAGGGSLVSGTEKSMERVQRSSAHFAQRPDRMYVPLDTALTSLAGWTVQASFDRTGGRHWLFGASTKVDSENFETNDFAVLNGADGLLVSGTVRYRETQPGRVLRNYSVVFDVSNDSTLRWLRQDGHVRTTLNLTWVNFWTSSLAVSRTLPQVSVSLTRGGPVMARGPGWSTILNVGNARPPQRG